MPEVFTAQEVVLDNPGLEAVTVHEVLNSMKKGDKAFSSEEFANQLLTIRLAESGDEFEDKFVPVNVGETMVAIPRGMQVKVKRKYVEVLARAREIRYSQKNSTPGELDKIEMHGRVFEKYPFTVIHDPHPKGPAWLKAIREEPIG